MPHRHQPLDEITMLAKNATAAIYGAGATVVTRVSLIELAT